MCCGRCLGGSVRTWCICWPRASWVLGSPASPTSGFSWRWLPSSTRMCLAAHTSWWLTLLPAPARRSTSLLCSRTTPGCRYVLLLCPRVAVAFAPWDPFVACMMWLQVYLLDKIVTDDMEWRQRDNVRPRFKRGTLVSSGSLRALNLDQGRCPEQPLTAAKALQPLQLPCDMVATTPASAAAPTPVDMPTPDAMLPSTTPASCT